jgi:hypothetical protein
MSSCCGAELSIEITYTAIVVTTATTMTITTVVILLSYLTASKN